MKLKYFGMFLALGLLASCANDKMEGPAQPGADNGAMSGSFLSFNLNPVSRTATGDQKEDPEEVKPGESDIKSIHVALVDPTSNDVLVSKTITTGISGTKATFELDEDDFKALVKYEGTQVKVYIVCNPNRTTITGTNFNPAEKTVDYLTDDNSLWSATNGFQMSNADANLLCTIDPVGIKNGKYTKENPHSLGTITVQRTMARLDLGNAQPNSTVSDVKLTFDGVALVNLSKSFYLFKQVGIDPNYVLWADETDKNWVKDPKTAWNKNTLHYAVEDKIATDARDFKKWFEGDAMATWRYVTPNTVMDVNDQMNGRSTGIIFRAEMTKEDGSALTAGDELISYYDVVWGSLADLQAIVANPSGAQQVQIADIYKAAIGNETDNAKILDALKAAKFDVFPKKDGKFYCYYYYWVRHNAPAGTFNNGKMHEMEFGVVRNNIYKITVKDVANLGYPGDFVPDPNTPDDPEKPEIKNTALTVNVQVKDWEVREDNIEF
ncbi:MAG: Mfa1 fimbrilin C-terminal domain-containing protein [Muribaculaceae bacterium]|nr:Mfa1 fimbrilin C-terminal domain-containing protein [Muribaculaceae bacterium]